MQLIVKLIKADALLCTHILSHVLFLSFSRSPFAFSFLWNFTFSVTLCLCVPVSENIHLSFLWTSNTTAPCIWNPFVPRETVWLSQLFLLLWAAVTDQCVVYIVASLLLSRNCEIRLWEQNGGMTVSLHLKNIR